MVKPYKEGRQSRPSRTWPTWVSARTALPLTLELTYLVDMTQRTFSTASLAIAAGLFFWHSASQAESINAGEHGPSSSHPFTVQAVAEFDTPWAIAFLPNGRMLITEKPGRIFLTTQNGEKLEVGNVPAVAASGQDGLLDIAIAPDFATSSRIYFTYVDRVRKAAGWCCPRAPPLRTAQPRSPTRLSSGGRHLQVGAVSQAASSPSIPRARICS